MSLKIRCLWIDDEPERVGLEGLAITYDIILNVFKLHNDGINELSKNFYKYDAIILDVKGWFKSDNEQQNIDGFFFSMNEVNSLRQKYSFLPCYVLTGQPDKIENEEFQKLIAASNLQFFKKPLQNEELLLKIIEDVKSLEFYQIKNDFKEVFTLFSENILDQGEKELLSILSALKKPNESFDDELYFTQIRIILESLFRKANKIGLLHNKCLPGGKVNLSESCLFLSGKPTLHLEVSCKKNHFGRIISDSVNSILTITGAASHTVESDIRNNINLKEHRIKNNTPYLLYSLTFQLMDVLIWFKKYSDEYSNIEDNKLLWVPPEPIIGEWIIGEVANVSESKGFAFFKSKNLERNVIIPPKMVSDFRLNDGDKISVKIENYKDKVGDTKTRVKEIKK